MVALTYVRSVLDTLTLERKIELETTLLKRVKAFIESTHCESMTKEQAWAFFSTGCQLYAALTRKAAFPTHATAATRMVAGKRCSSDVTLPDVPTGS